MTPSESMAIELLLDKAIEQINVYLATNGHSLLDETKSTSLSQAAKDLDAIRYIVRAGLER